MGVDLHFIVSLDKYNWKQTFMQTHGMCADLDFQMSLDKQNWKNMLRQTQSMGADLLFQARPTAISRMLQAIQFPMDWRTNRVAYRVACTQLKIPRLMQQKRAFLQT